MSGGQTGPFFFCWFPARGHCYSKTVASVGRICGWATSRAWSTQSNSIIALIFNLTLVETRPRWNCLAPLWSACLCAESRQKGFYQKQASFKAGKRRCIFHTQLYYLRLSISAMTSLVKGDPLPEQLELIQTLFKWPVKKVFFNVNFKGLFFWKRLFLKVSKGVKRMELLRRWCLSSVCIFVRALPLFARTQIDLIMKKEELPVVVKEPGFHCLAQNFKSAQSDKL